ncbi:hypothetical protein [Streptomyces turgidiscabies]|uniref:hypothetical protein n=1 Tax=Streptomyces turgidiscabies TaxID=85558 RepID=UPI0027D7E7C8|nr:hypothetical protein [Streptomyces turgidiscabies]
MTTQFLPARAWQRGQFLLIQNRRATCSFRIGRGAPSAGAGRAVCAGGLPIATRVFQTPICSC